MPNIALERGESEAPWYDVRFKTCEKNRHRCKLGSLKASKTWHPAIWEQANKLEQENDRVGVPDKEVAAQLGLSLDVVCRRRKLLGLPRIRKEIWTAEVLASLGKEPDSKIAKRFGFHVRSVLVKRQSLGIASHRNSLTELWTEENLGLLGKISD